MATPQYKCISAFLLNNQLMVVGGYIITSDESLESVEFAKITVTQHTAQCQYMCTSIR